MAWSDEEGIDKGVDGQVYLKRNTQSKDKLQ